MVVQVGGTPAAVKLAGAQGVVVKRVGVAVGVEVSVGVDVSVGVEVSVGVSDGVGVSEGVEVSLGVLVGPVGVMVGVSLLGVAVSPGASGVRGLVLLPG